MYVHLTTLGVIKHSSATANTSWIPSNALKHLICHMRVPFLFLPKHEACSPDKRIGVITSFLPHEGKQSSTNPRFTAGVYTTPMGLPSTESFGREGIVMPTLTAQEKFNVQRDVWLLSGLLRYPRVLQHSPTSLTVPTVSAPKAQDISTLQH